MSTLEHLTQQLHTSEEQLLGELRRQRRAERGEARGATRPKDDLTLGQRIADAVAAGMGSWPFIIIQSAILGLWITANVMAWIKHWDPYPFILLNLALSFQAAYAAPFIMMSQNRQQDIDRKAAEHDYQVNIKAELEIELLHQKLDQLREEEVADLAKAVRALTEQLRDSRTPAQATAKPAAKRPSKPPASSKA